MINYKDCKIMNELNQEDMINWFDMKDKKFLHNIDTFYYSVKLVNDFTKDTEDKKCLAFRDFINKHIDRTTYDFCKPINHLMNIKTQLNLKNQSFAKFYLVDIECPEMFDMFFAESVPANADGVCVTGEIIVQLRSYLLWQYGVTKAFEYSYEVLKAVLDYFGLEILEVKENRIDYCWHSNYLQNPEKFFRIDNFAKMQVSRFKRVHYEYALKSNDEYEGDYICLGKRGDKVFVRIYLKSKEVVEKGYKPWFLKEWLFNNMINRYDFYVYEKAFLKHAWNYIDIARLEFYSEYGSDEGIKSLCRNIVSGKVEKSDIFISKLADELTPRVTLVTNVEFQTCRKMTKSYELLPIKDNTKDELCKRVYDYLDNRPLITEYLTRSTLRLVSPSADTNKSRADYCAFWQALRNTKMVDVKKAPKELKLIRSYTRKLNSEVVKKRALSAAVSFSLYTQGINDNSGIEDAANLLLTLNDNDIYEMKRLKGKRAMQLNQYLTSEDISPGFKRYTIIDDDTGEIKYGSKNRSD